jgi:hypothetical protein
MKRAIVGGLCLISCLALAGAGQPQPKAKQPPGHPQGASPPALPKPAQDWPLAKAEDVGSVDAIVAAYYASTAGDAGQPRQWERFQSLFLPEGRLVAVRAAADGAAGAAFLPVADYIQMNRKYFEKRGFTDKEIARRVESFGNIAHVWSTYESRENAKDPVPYSRGIASIQLLKDGDRWWIANVFWDRDRPEAPIPEKYLHNPG